MDIAIFGANGQTGRLLTGQALAAGHRVVAVTRRPDDFPLSDPKLTVAVADVREAAAVTTAAAALLEDIAPVRIERVPPARDHQLAGRHGEG